MKLCQNDYQMVMMLENHPDWMKIVDCFQMAGFRPSRKFYASPSNFKYQKQNLPIFDRYALRTPNIHCMK